PSRLAPGNEMMQRSHRTSQAPSLDGICHAMHKDAQAGLAHIGMSDRWAGRTVLRGSWLQFEAVELPVRALTADTALNHRGQGARRCVRNEMAKEAAGPTVDVSARGWPHCGCLRGGRQGLIGQGR